MKLSSKHGNERTIEFNSFAGGLHTSTAQEMIAENELAACMNMEACSSTGLLKVVDGCERVFTPPSGVTLQAVIYDKINSVFLVVDTAHKVYTITLAADKPVLSAAIGTLTGTLFPVYIAWENGIILASGGQLQYWNGTALTTLANSPKMSTFVYAKNGRLITNDLTSGNESNLYFSATGDEETWADQSNVDSSGKWIEVGYKDGSKITAFMAMGQDLAVLKSNRCVYRLTGAYPNWAVDEVSRNVDCSGRQAWYVDGENLYIMGATEIQLLNTGQFYGDIKSQNVADKVSDKLEKATARMMFVPTLQQVWIPLNDRYILMFDVKLQAFYMRRLEEEDIADVCCAGNDTWIVRPSSIAKIKKHCGYDMESKMQWRFLGKRMVNEMNNYLLKRGNVGITPYFDTLIEGNIRIGAIALPLPTPYAAFKLYHNYSKVYHNRRHVCGANERSYNLYDTGDMVYENYDRVYHNNTLVCNPSVMAMGSWANNRSKTTTISGSGAGCCFLINSINMLIAEV